MTTREKVRLFTYTCIILFATLVTWALKAQQKVPEKKYSVSLTLNEWIVISQKLEYVKSQLKQSDLPSRNTSYISDSLLTPIRDIIASQVNAQIESEKTKPETKKDSTKPKKN